MGLLDKLSKVPFIGGLNEAATSVKDLFGSEANPYSLLLSHGVHHNCQYAINIPIPEKVLQMINASNALSVSGSTLTERLNYYCTEVNVPSTSIASAQIRVGGEVIEIPYDRLYGEFQTTFYVDGGYADDGGLTMKTFQGWIDTIYPPISRNFAYPDEYTTTIKIALITTPDSQPLFGAENIVMLNLMEAWPSSIQAATLSGRTGNEPTSFVVVWKYRYMIAADVSGDSSVLSGVMDFIKNGFRLARSVNNVIDNIKDTINDVKDAWKKVKDWF